MKCVFFCLIKIYLFCKTAIDKLFSYNKSHVINNRDVDTGTNEGKDYRKYLENNMACFLLTYCMNTLKHVILIQFFFNLIKTPQLWNCVFTTLAKYWQRFAHICNWNSATNRVDSEIKLQTDGLYLLLIDCFWVVLKEFYLWTRLKKPNFSPTSQNMPNKKDQ